MKLDNIFKVLVISMLLMIVGQSCFDKGEESQEQNLSSDKSSVPNIKVGPYSIAIVKIENHSWEIEGACNKKGDDISFYRAGEPLMTLGINANDLSVTGNMRSKKDNISFIIGTPELPAPSVTSSGDTYKVSGTFLVLDGTKVEGSVSLQCKS